MTLPERLLVEALTGYGVPIPAGTALLASLPSQERVERCPACDAIVQPRGPLASRLCGQCR